MAYTTIVSGTTITAAWANASVRDQSVSTFASSAARDSAISVPVAGMIAYIGNGQWTSYDGTGWIMTAEPAQAYTPALTNITLGNGTRSGSYHRSDGWCDFEAIFTMGSTSAMGTNPEIGLPVAAAAYRANRFFVDILDTGTTQFVGVTGALAGAATSVVLFRADTAATTLNSISIASTGPMTWVTGDILSVAGRFKMNTRYL